MIKRMSILARKEGVDSAEFERRWFEQHAAMVRQVKGVRGYVQNRVVAAAGGGAPIDGVAEIWFDDAQTMEAVLSSSAWQDVVADAREFVGSVTTLSVDERTVVAARA